jgi:hypothetical protein
MRHGLIAAINRVFFGSVAQPFFRPGHSFDRNRAQRLSRLAEGHRTATRSGLDGCENGSTLARPGSTNLMKKGLDQDGYSNNGEQETKMSDISMKPTVGCAFRSILITDSV